jgi:hypothetical protein
MKKLSKLSLTRESLLSLAEDANAEIAAGRTGRVCTNLTVCGIISCNPTCANTECGEI